MIPNLSYLGMVLDELEKRLPYTLSPLDLDQKIHMGLLYLLNAKLILFVYLCVCVCVRVFVFSLFFRKSQARARFNIPKW